MWMSVVTSVSRISSRGKVPYPLVFPFFPLFLFSPLLTVTFLSFPSLHCWSGGQSPSWTWSGVLRADFFWNLMYDFLHSSDESVIFEFLCWRITFWVWNGCPFNWPDSEDRGVARNLFWGGIGIQFQYSLCFTCNTCWRHCYSIKSLLGLILGGYIYRYTPRRYAPGRGTCIVWSDSHPNKLITRLFWQQWFCCSDSSPSFSHSIARFLWEIRFQFCCLNCEKFLVHNWNCCFAEIRQIRSNLVTHPVPKLPSFFLFSVSPFPIRPSLPLFFFIGIITTRLRVLKWRCGKRGSGLRSTEYLESAEKLRIFRRRYIVGILTNKTNISI